MATIEEKMMEDAANSVETTYTMSAGDVFQGNLSTVSDEDWIKVELTEGALYTINLSRIPFTPAGLSVWDTVLKLFNSKGEHIQTNDDIDSAGGNLNSSFQFVPEVTGYYYISAGAYDGDSDAYDLNYGSYTLTVTESEDPNFGDTIKGTDSNDKLLGTEKSETIKGLDDWDALFGLDGDDTLEGGWGNDLLVGGKGSDKLIGGPDEDTISYYTSTAGVTINLTDYTARGGDADGDTFGDDIEHITGSDYDDILTGNAGRNSLRGLGGDDELNGGRGHDYLDGGRGDDTLDGGTGRNTLKGGDGADTLLGGSSQDTLEGGPGPDVLIGGDDGPPSIFIRRVGDFASYESSMTGVTVRLHNSQLKGGDAEGDSFGGVISASYTDKDDEEQVEMLPDIENIRGSAHADVLAGNFRNNVIEGGAGDDRLYGGPNPADASMTNGPENSDSLFGDAGDDVIYGGPGDDYLEGGEDDDTLFGGTGSDALFGGRGSDMIYADAEDVDGYIQINGYENAVDNEGNFFIEPHTDIDTLSFARVENDDDDGIGSADSPLTLGTQSDENGYIVNIENLIGSGFDDYLTGDAGDNVIEGGEGADTLDGAAGNDTLSYESSDDRVRITLNDSGAATTNRGHASGDTAVNFENIIGSAHDDELVGNNQDNVIEGGPGADEMDGGAHTDSATTGNYGDTLSYKSSDAGVTVNLATARVSGGHAEGDTIEIEELDHDGDDQTDRIDVSTFESATGSSHDDTLIGDYRRNRLDGGDGDDILRAGAGWDDLIGGPGADILDGGEDKGEKDNMVPGDANADGVVDAGERVRASIDYALYWDAEESVTVDLSTGKGTGGEAEGDTLVDIEAVWGSWHNDVFIASNHADIIIGQGGRDTISYEASETGVTIDLSDDAQHTTVLATGAGTPDDPLFFGAPSGPLSATGVPRHDAMGNPFDAQSNVESDDNPNTNGAAGDVLSTIENIDGSSHNDDLTGDENPNNFKGMDGDDMLNGGASDDVLVGGAGDDALDGGAGTDLLVGGLGDDTLRGGTGTDFLVDGPGNDDLYGGDDADFFMFSPAFGTGGSDVILDWSDGDKIDLSAFDLTEEQVIDAITLRGRGEDAYVVINLEKYGGGRVTIRDINSLDDLDDVADNPDTPVDETSNGVIEILSVYIAGVTPDGIFLLDTPVLSDDLILSLI
ncbi:MAG: hypothetical protein OXN26_17485 [Gammaproteobacteria bacterium]|nr:hypothetical protein [Gammaproteobacteria bacterium]